eukprot:TRINITY_DN11347_c0_g1_i1.p2 TRINITY_DN11347_c0_g1~~TRINITY_DN11347_c0_g1_i1.p2  ORF type:complete len:195 (+),score=36.72 TRINITY_DN11347_c0_g1_i1:178-762(+)
MRPAAEQRLPDPGCQLVQAVTPGARCPIRCTARAPGDAERAGRPPMLLWLRKGRSWVPAERAEGGGSAGAVKLTMPEDAHVVDVLEAVAEFGLLGFADAKVGSLQASAGAGGLSNRALLKDAVSDGAAVYVALRDTAARAAEDSLEEEDAPVSNAVILWRIAVLFFGCAALFVLLRDIVESGGVPPTAGARGTV